MCVFSGRTENSGVVSTANYRARELGVRSGIPIAVAKSRLKDTDAKFVPIDHAKYEEYSSQVMEMVRDGRRRTRADRDRRGFLRHNQEVGGRL